VALAAPPCPSAARAAGRALAWFAALAVLAGAPVAALAQRTVPPARRGALRPVLRADAILATRTALQLAVGLDAPAGTYVRIEGTLGAGPSVGPGGARASARADVVARFLLDPFRQLRRGPYAGGGVSVRREGGRTAAGLVALLGVEGAVRQGYAPSLELGLGRGVRLGVVLRRARTAAR
jgi:hypothetical protein